MVDLIGWPRFLIIKIVSLAIDSNMSMRKKVTLGFSG